MDSSLTADYPSAITPRGGRSYMEQEQPNTFPPTQTPAETSWWHRDSIFGMSKIIGISTICLNALGNGLSDLRRIAEQPSLARAHYVAMRSLSFASTATTIGVTMICAPCLLEILRKGSRYACVATITAAGAAFCCTGAPVPALIAGTAAGYLTNIWEKLIAE